MKKTFERAISRESRRGRVRAIVLDAAILYEAGWDTLCDTIIFIDASPEVRLARLEANRGWTAEVLQAREKVQGPLEEKRRQADHILTNDGLVEAFEASATALWSRLLNSPRRQRGSGKVETSPAARGQPPS